VLDHPRLIDPRLLFRFHLDPLFVFIDEHVALLRLELRALLVRGEADIGPNAAGNAAILVLAQDRGREARTFLLPLALLLLALLLALDHALASHVRLLALFLCEPGLTCVLGDRLARSSLLIGFAVLACVIGMIGRRVVIALGIMRDGGLAQI